MIAMAGGQSHDGARIMAERLEGVKAPVGGSLCSIQLPLQNYAGYIDTRVHGRAGGRSVSPLVPWARWGTWGEKIRALDGGWVGAKFQRRPMREALGLGAGRTAG